MQLATRSIFARTFDYCLGLVIEAIIRDFQYSTPTRIVEAVGPLTVVLSTFRTIYGNQKVDVVPNLYLAVALSKTAGEEARALEAYKLATDNINSLNIPKKNLIWAMANIAHLFRRLNRIPEAEEQERLAR